MRGRMVLKKKCVWVEEGVEAGGSQQLGLCQDKATSPVNKRHMQRR